MSLRYLAGLAFLLFLTQGFAQVATASCLSYEPAVVTVQGKLVRKTFPGPPNYKDIRTGDEVETNWYLALDSPICVNEDTAEPNLNPAKNYVRQL